MACMSNALISLGVIVAKAIRQWWRVRKKKCVWCGEDPDDTCLAWRPGDKFKMRTKRKVVVWCYECLEEYQKQ